MRDTEFMKRIEKYRHEFYAFVQRNVWNQSDVEDVFSSAVLAAYESRRNFRPQSNFRAWMYRILMNKCFIANREKREASADIDALDAQWLADESKMPKPIIEDPERLVHECPDEVLRALSRLRTIERSCLLLLSLGGYSYSEIAEIVGIPVTSVTTHLARGRAKLRRWLTDYAKEYGLSCRAIIDSPDRSKEMKGSNDG